MIKSKTIWLTRKITKEERDFCSSLGLVVHEVPAIEIELNPFENVSIPHSAAWAFTSQHAVEWVKLVIDAGLLKPELLPDQWFAVGQKTAKAIQDLRFEPIVPEQAYGSNLAVLLDTYKVRSVLHFTGNLARPELAQLCFIYGINYHPFEVYKTKVLEPDSFPQEKPDAIVFLSPSAVEGFTSSDKAKNRLKDAPLFAIGKTTQQSLLELGFESQIPPKATFVELMKFVAEQK